MSKVNQLTHWTIIYSPVYSHLSITRNKENRHTDAFVKEKWGGGKWGRSFCFCPSLLFRDTGGRKQKDRPPNSPKEPLAAVHYEIVVNPAQRRCPRGGRW